MRSQRRGIKQRTGSVIGLFGITAAVIIVFNLSTQTPSAQARPAQEVAFTVTDSGDTNDATPGDNLCQTAAGTCTLRAAITESNAHASGSFAITLPAMTINLTGTYGDNANQGGDLDVTSAVTLMISGVPGGTIIDGQNNDRVLHLLNPSASVTLNGLLIQHGKSYDGSWGCGGGIYNEGSLLVIQGGSLIRQNQAATPYGGGGGLCSDFGSRVTISGDGTRLEGNSAFEGGAIFNRNSDLTLEAGVQIVQNASPGIGGGIYTDGDSSVAIRGVSFLNNTALQGGAILNANNPKAMIIENSIFSGNSATGTDDGGYGGALSSGYQSELFITGSTLSDNTASKGGGAIDNGYQARLTISGSTLTGNSGPQGGAIRSRAATVLLVDSTLAQNQGGRDLQLRRWTAHGHHQRVGE